MKKTLFFLLLFYAYSTANAQMNVRFGTNDARFDGAFTDVEATEPGTQVLTAGTIETLTSTTYHNLFDEINNDFSNPGGVDDLTLIQTLQTIPIDAYGELTVDGDASKKMNITQNSIGLTGTNSQGILTSSKTSTGDYRSFEIKVLLANHVQVTAENFSVVATSMNTAGSAFESTTIIFLDPQGNPYGTADYNGFYQDASPNDGNHPGIVATNNCHIIPTKNANNSIYSTSGLGVFIAADTEAVDLGNDACNANSGVDGIHNSATVNAFTDAGLNPTDLIGGFIYTTRLENVRTQEDLDGITNTTSTTLGSRLEGFNIIGGTLLPIDLVSFEARKKTDHVELHWETDIEENADYFQIERSEDGSRFTPIGQVFAKGEGQYQSSDFNPLIGENYYRLKMVDLDESFSYSEIKQVNFFKKEITANVFPNPTKSAFTATANAVIDMYLLHDMQGKLLRKVSCKDQALTVKTSDLNNGVYWVTLVIDGQLLKKRIVKV